MVIEVDAEAAEAEVAVAVAAIEIIKTPVLILVRTWTISNLNILDMDIENVIRIIETREGIKEAAVVVVVAVVIVEILAVAGTTVRVTIKVTVKIIIKVTAKIRVTAKIKVIIKIISSRNIPAREIRMEVTIGAAGIIRTEGKVEEGEVEFKVDGIRVGIMRTPTNAAATTKADNTENATFAYF